MQSQPRLSVIKAITIIDVILTLNPNPKPVVLLLLLFKFWRRCPHPGSRESGEWLVGQPLALTMPAQPWISKQLDPDYPESNQFDVSKGRVSGRVLGAAVVV